ncbi:zinc-binding dehydrogenase [Paenibacillus sp. CC-CFT747]|nr:zinc-binding dehydrogenase [Paenibacillus sp. CC-CFT747]
MDLHAERLEMAEALGAVPLSPKKDDVAAEVIKRTGGGADIAVDAVGASLTRSQCMEAVVPGGASFIRVYMKRSPPCRSTR